MARTGEVVARVTLTNGTSGCRETGVGTLAIVSAGIGALGWSLVRCIKTVGVVVTGKMKLDTLA